MAKKKGPVQLSNLLKKGRKRFGESESEEKYDFLAEREAIIERAKEKNEPAKRAEALKSALEVEATKKKAEAPAPKAVTPTKSPVVEPKVNSKQTVNKVETKGQQTVTKELSNSKQTVIQTVTETVNKNETVNKPVSINSEPYDYKDLTGNQKKILYFIYQECNKEAGLNTGKIHAEALAAYINTSGGTIRVTINRLIKKGLIHIARSKTGRGGWSSYGMSKELYQNLKNDEYYLDSIDKKLLTKPLTELQTNPSSSSSNLNYNKTNNTKTVNDLPVDWAEIFIPQQLKEYRFGKPHLLQLFNKGLYKSEDIQASLDHFIWDLDNGKLNIRTGPVNFLMGVLHKGTPYISDSYTDYILKEQRRRFKAVEEYKQLMKLEVKEEHLREFEAFWDSLDQSDRDAYVPPNAACASGSEIQKIIGQSKFIESKP